MPGKKPKKHAIAQKRTIGGFQPIRWIVCRCGWETEHHYQAKYVMELFRAHQSERAAAGEA